MDDSKKEKLLYKRKRKQIYYERRGRKGGSNDAILQMLIICYNGMEERNERWWNKLNGERERERVSEMSRRKKWIWIHTLEVYKKKKEDNISLESSESQ